MEFKILEGFTLSTVITKEVGRRSQELCWFCLEFGYTMKKSVKSLGYQPS